MSTAAAIVTVLVGIVVLLGATRWLVRRRATAAARIPAGPGLPAATIVGTVLILGGGATSSPAYWAAAGVAALCATAAIAMRFEIGTALGGPAYSVPSLAHRPPGSPGAITGGAALAAAAAALATATLAYRARLLGPSDPALVALAAYIGMLLECRLHESSGSGPGMRVAAGAAAALTAAGLGAALVVLLP